MNRQNEFAQVCITDIMFKGTDEDLRQTKSNSTCCFFFTLVGFAKTMKDKFSPDMVAGRPLGEFSALVAAEH